MHSLLHHTENVLGVKLSRSQSQMHISVLVPGQSGRLPHTQNIESSCMSATDPAVCPQLSQPFSGCMQFSALAPSHSLSAWAACHIHRVCIPVALPQLTQLPVRSCPSHLPAVSRSLCWLPATATPLGPPATYTESQSQLQLPQLSRLLPSRPGCFVLGSHGDITAVPRACPPACCSRPR